MNSIDMCRKTGLSEFEQKIDEVNKILCIYCNETVSCELCCMRSELWHAEDLLKEIWNLAASEKEKHQCIETALVYPEKIIRESLMCSWAFDAYENKDYDLAAYTFMRGAQLGSIEANNNYAYMNRKRLYHNSEQYAPLEILKILQPGIKALDAFSLLNAAMVLCLMLGTDTDWKISDNLISCLQHDISSVVKWWESLGQSGDPEGYLVHLLMLRHHVITESELGTRQVLWEKVRAAYPNAPAWLNTDSEQKAPPFQYPEQESE